MSTEQENQIEKMKDIAPAPHETPEQRRERIEEATARARRVVGRRRDAYRKVAEAFAKAQKVAAGEGEKLSPSELKKIRATADNAAGYNIDYHCLRLMQGDTFFCSVSQRLKKVPTFMLPTAAIAYNPRSSEFALLYNPFFMASLNEAENRFVLKHEFYHFVLGHLTSRRRELAQLWNIGTDLAINDLLRNANDQSTCSAPDMVLMPGKRPQSPPEEALRKMTPEEKIANEKMADLIENIEKGKASEWYYRTIKDFCEQNDIPMQQECAACKAGVPLPGQQAAGKDKQDPQKGDQESKDASSGGDQGDSSDGDSEGSGSGSGAEPGDAGGSGEGDAHSHGGGQPEHTCGKACGGINSFDDHSSWGDVPEDQKDYADAKAKKIIGDAVREADQSNTWGSVPAEMQGHLREMYSRQINWKAVLRNFIGRARGATHRSSMKVINRRYPYVHPGTKRGYTTNIRFYIDQSGSVDDRSLELLFGELNNLTRTHDIELYFFDHSVDTENVVKWKKNMKVRPRRTRCGGTSFDAVVEHLNATCENVDAALIMSDGECSQPAPAAVKFGYVIVPGRQMLFKPRPNEIHIQMKDSKAEVLNRW